jgi:hypothetical protein
MLCRRRGNDHAIYFFIVENEIKIRSSSHAIPYTCFLHRFFASIANNPKRT